MKSFSAILIPFVFATSALAHGVVTKITIDGKDFEGNVPGNPKDPSIIRLISDASPVKGANNPAVNCGPDAGPAKLVADAKPGSSISFLWTAADRQKWPHNTGPMLTYMASCGDTTCDKFDSKQAKWFKIQQVGRKPGSSDWAQADLMDQGAPAKVTIPKNIAPGNYLIRHEIIALHLAEQKGGAEFYPSCAQLRISGSGTGKPTANELVSLPGAYSDDDAGIFDKNVFNAKAAYQFPGPKIAAFVGGDDSGNDNDNDNNAPAPSTPTKSSGGSKPAQTQGTKGSCKLQKRAAPSAADENVRIVRPRHISRIMRGVIAGHHSPRF